MIPRCKVYWPIRRQIRLKRAGAITRRRVLRPTVSAPTLEDRSAWKRRRASAPRTPRCTMRANRAATRPCRYGARRRPGSRASLADNIGHPTFASPHSKPIAVAGSFVYVANTPADTVDVIDTNRREVTARIHVGVDPVSVAVRPDGSEIWAANHVSDSVRCHRRGCVESDLPAGDRYYSGHRSRPFRHPL